MTTCRPAFLSSPCSRRWQRWPLGPARAEVRRPPAAEQSSRHRAQHDRPRPRSASDDVPTTGPADAAMRGRSRHRRARQRASPPWPRAQRPLRAQLKPAAHRGPHGLALPRGPGLFYQEEAPAGTAGAGAATPRTRRTPTNADLRAAQPPGAPPQDLPGLRRRHASQHRLERTARQRDRATAPTSAGTPTARRARSAPAEHGWIQEVWRQVAETYAPFDVDVTTQDPGPAGSPARPRDTTYGTHVLITSSATAARAGCAAAASASPGSAPSTASTRAATTSRRGSSPTTRASTR